MLGGQGLQDVRRQGSTRYWKDKVYKKLGARVYKIQCWEARVYKMFGDQGLQDAGRPRYTRSWETKIYKMQYWEPGVYKMLGSQGQQDAGRPDSTRCSAMTQGAKDTVTDHPETHVTLVEKSASQQ